VSTGLIADLDTGKQSARLYFKVIAEPGLNGFQYQQPVLLSAEDARQNQYSKEENSHSYWERCYEGQMDFTNDWQAMEIPLQSPETSTFTRLSFAVPVRFVLTNHEVHLDPSDRGAESRITFQGRTYSVEAFQSSGLAANAQIQINGKGRYGRNLDTLDFFLDRGGERICTLQKRSTSITSSPESFSMNFKLVGNLNETLEPEESCQILITWPNESKNEQIRFDFENLVLP